MRRRTRERRLRQRHKARLPTSLLDDRVALDAVVQDIKHRHAHVPTSWRHAAGFGGPTVQQAAAAQALFQRRLAAAFVT